MASNHRSRYPFLSNDDFEKYKDNPVKLDIVNEMRENDFNKKKANFSLSENKSIVAIRPKDIASNELRIVIIGKTGQGKSATANTILGKEKFKEEFTATYVTRESRCFTEVVDGRKISIMDTPGLQDTHRSNQSILKELVRMTKLFPDGIHAFLHVVNMADPRFTAEDKNVFDLIEKTFGGGFQNYCLLVFSHGDSALKDIDLDTYRRKQMEINQATRGHPTQHYFRKFQRGQDQYQRGFANLLDEYSWKMLAIDNKTSIPFEKAYYRKQIVAMVDLMITSNSPKIYTNDMFAKAKQEREAMRQKGLMKGWDLSSMSKVETILAANPSISREQLEEKVSRQLHDENQDKLMELQRKVDDLENARIAKEKHIQQQKRIDGEKREAEEKERRKRQEKEDQERKDRFQKEEQEKQERRKREDRERQKRFLLEENERQRWAAKEQEKHLTQMQLQNYEWDKRRKEEKEEYETRQQRQKALWEDQVRAVEEEHISLLEKNISGIVSAAKRVVDWFV